MNKYNSLADRGRLQLVKHLKTDWFELLQTEFEQTYFKQLENFLSERMAAGVEIYPQTANIFHALNLTPVADVKVILLGQDPYHGPGQAHGLSFSVPDGIACPPSLRNIFKELKTDLDIQEPAGGNLEKWARQGVLLLNTVLTVERGQAASHSKRGWERVTDRIIQIVNEQNRPTVFLLWGGQAQKKAALIDDTRHHILQAPHPSPLSVYRGFFGCRHFSLCNEFLNIQGRGPIDWSLT